MRNKKKKKHQEASTPAIEISIPRRWTVMQTDKEVVGIFRRIAIAKWQQGRDEYYASLEKQQ